MRYDFDKAKRVAADKKYMLMEEHQESVRPVLLKTAKGNFFLLWENTEGDFSGFKALTKKQALKWCVDIDVTIAEKEFADIIKDA